MLQEGGDTRQEGGGAPRDSTATVLNSRRQMAEALKDQEAVKQVKARLRRYLKRGKTEVPGRQGSEPAKAIGGPLDRRTR